MYLIIIVILITLPFTLYLFSEKQKMDKLKFKKKPSHYPLVKNALTLLIPILITSLLYILYTYFTEISPEAIPP